MTAHIHARTHMHMNTHHRQVHTTGPAQTHGHTQAKLQTPIGTLSHESDVTCPNAKTNVSHKNTSPHLQIVALLVQGGDFAFHRRLEKPTVKRDADGRLAAQGHDRQQFVPTMQQARPNHTGRQLVPHRRHAVLNAAHVLLCVVQLRAGEGRRRKAHGTRSHTHQLKPSTIHTNASTSTNEIENYARETALG